MEKKIKKINALKKLESKLKVVAYARVSTGKDAMLHSLSSQVTYYKNFIQSNKSWQYAGIYADEALSGTKEDRTEFQRMINDCKDGKIDLIITKSISRFARNTLTLLKVVRMLKELNVDVFFEEQNIHSISGDGELVLTFLASFAQEEAKTVSDNIKWRVKKNFENGMPWNGTILGYRMVNGKYEIVEEEAKVVKEIFNMYVSGKGRNKIVKYLNDKGLKTRKGNDWTLRAVTCVLNDYTYTGNLVLQTTFRNNFIDKKKLINNGQLPKYVVEESHDPIISIELFKEAQEIKEKNIEHFKVSKVAPIRYPFSGKIKCGVCGAKYSRKKTKYNVYWMCRTFNEKGKDACQSKQIPEDILYSLCCKALDIKEFDENEFSNQIDFIEVFNGNIVDFNFKNGIVKRLEWEDKSRKKVA